MYLVTGTSEEDKGRMIGLWVTKMLGKPLHPPFTALGWLNDKDSLVGASVFNSANGANLEVTIYGPRVMTRQTIRQTLRYAFDQEKCIRLTGRCVRSNHKMRKLFPRMGFEFEGTMARYFGPERKDDALVYRMFRPQAERWMK